MEEKKQWSSEAGEERGAGRAGVKKAATIAFLHFSFTPLLTTAATIPFLINSTTQILLVHSPHPPFAFPPIIGYISGYSVQFSEENPMVSLTQARLDAIFAGFAGKRIAVVGDLMLDRYFWGAVSRISPEAPVPVVEVEEESTRLGGAANVANNIASLGGVPVMFGVVGDDHHPPIDSFCHY